ncbi:MAG TPA: hypothetical protein VJ792_06655 [Candidatus Nitrosotalea sp.]|nr:hypothetical protein [Candidatus Nitrosotalea sp.]
MSEEFLKNVKTLLASGKGDGARLREILDSIKRNIPVVMSDYKYVQTLVSEESTTDKAAVENMPADTRLEDPIQLLRIRLAEGKITVEEFRDLKKAISEY